MKEHPILFSAPMVRAILAGKKTVTRRVIKWPILGPGDGRKRRVYGPDSDIDEIAKICPLGKPGELLWVRESFCENYFGDAQPETQKHAYAADWDDSAVDVCSRPRWTPSIHMPRRASRITLSITGVATGRLQDITEEQAQAEGCSVAKFPDTWLCVPADEGAGAFEMFIEPDEQYRKEHGIAFVKRQRSRMTYTARDRFSSLWTDINGKRSGCAWRDNPWVWALSFRRVTP